MPKRQRATLADMPLLGEVEVVGIDPSLSSTGLYSMDGRADTIKTDPNDPSRLHAIRAGVKAFIGGPFPQTVAIVEDLPANAMGAGKTGMAQGVIRELLQFEEVPYLTLSPATVKKMFTGSGRADKKEMIQRCFELGFSPADDNQADAFALAHVGMTIIDDYQTGFSSFKEPKGGWACNARY